ncbi:DUF3467 domain-containing protein [Allosphingosinicella deserti]|uniref:DUF3467 domain-containing protein n=1 Tax=Allosphingosinicella deserti TaxID=2116704 RepID=A0A2P7QSU8_9SPHN|nr:DUF3467 domain-containing protein [Sphingomonas deserti]PSJ41031.1 DUF3467 domain-containing protein [Sphingomonas deserti]
MVTSRGDPIDICDDEGLAVRIRPPLACYANYFEVGHNAFEFLLDAGQITPESGEIRLMSRIAVSPVHAKLLARLLARSVDQFEHAFEPIPDLTEEGDDGADFELTSPGEFERRAIDARRRTIADPARAPGKPVSNER